jgi:hypothetical protein
MKIQCKTCLAMTDLPPGADPHAHTWCNCCTARGPDGQPHHHGQDVLDAPDCAQANHPGEPCWHPPAQPARPEKCTVCRPVMHLPTSGVRPPEVS